MKNQFILALIAYLFLSSTLLAQHSKLEPLANDLKWIQIPAGIHIKADQFFEEYRLELGLSLNSEMKLVSTTQGCGRLSGGRSLCVSGRWCRVRSWRLPGS